MSNHTKISNSTQHWNDIFSTKSDAELGWYESELSQSISFIEQVNLLPSSTVFIPGAGTSALVDELKNRSCNLILNDLSDGALTQLQTRLGKASADQKIDYLHHNMGLPFVDGTVNNNSIDLWLDRAVLHFLLSEEQITHYFLNLKNSVKKGGYVLLAEFAVGGAQKCAGLEVHQYSIDEMQQRLGANFELLTSENVTFVNPFKQERSYVYALFKRG